MMVSVVHNNNQVITNIWFKHHPRRLWTWKSPGGNIKNQINYITIKRFTPAVQPNKTYPGADCGSDHNPVIRALSQTKEGKEGQNNYKAKL